MVLQGSQQKKVMNLYQPVFVSYIDAKAGTIMSVTRGNLSHTEMKICEPVGVLQSCVDAAKQAWISENHSNVIGSVGERSLIYTKSAPR